MTIHEDFFARLGTYLGGVGVSVYSFAESARAEAVKHADAPVTLLQLDINVSSLTVGDVCAVAGAIAVVARVILDWKKYRDSKKK